jgi:hypothetical protein
MNTLPTRCPICEGGITVTKFVCEDCDVTIEGRFSVAGNRFSQLSDEQLLFVETFVRCEGKINRMESELDLSYPTIRARLHEVIRSLGYEPGKDDAQAATATSAAKAISDAERKRILEDLNAGRINAEQAMKQLNPNRTQE